MTTAIKTRYLLTGVADIDVTGSDPVVVTERHSTPCRRCLRDAEPGERVHLVSYDPFVTDSPYRSASPVFVHAEPCVVYRGHAIPESQRRRLLSVRAFDGDAMMRDAEVVEGVALADALDRRFADPATAFVHVHNAGPGCFAVRVDRVCQPDG
jgi:Protein of unknown function (DUF1203)